MAISRILTTAEENNNPLLGANSSARAFFCAGSALEIPRALPVNIEASQAETGLQAKSAKQIPAAVGNHDQVSQTRQHTGSGEISREGPMGVIR